MVFSDREGDVRQMFTSTLGVGEFALLPALGPTPVAQVMGAAVFQVGWRYLPTDAQWNGEVFCQLHGVEAAWSEARRQAFAQLAGEAHAAGADAVVGVRLRRGEHDWARGSVDYLVSGTAIRSGTPPAEPRDVVISDLSVQEYWKLAGTGWAPAGLVASTSVFFIAQSIGTQWRRRATVTRNQELTEYSRGFSQARTAAVQYARDQARRAGADGILRIKLAHDVSPEKLPVDFRARQPGVASPTTLAIGAEQIRGRDNRSGLVITIQAVGTAIRRGAQAAAPLTRPSLQLGTSA